MNSPAFRIYATTLLGLLAGCVSTSQLTPLPSEWAPVSATLVGDCALIAGRYASIGEQRGLEPRCKKLISHSTPQDEWWSCSISLNDAFKVGEDGERTEIAQPDPNTLTVSCFDMGQLRATRTYLRDKGEFRCEGHTLILTNVSSVFGGDVASMATAGGLLIGRVGTSRHEKAFARSSDGHLMMTITETNRGVIAPFGFHATFSAWLRWQQVSDKDVLGEAVRTWRPANRHGFAGN